MMSRLKILFLTRDFRHQVERSSYYLSRELAKQAELKMWHENGHISDILRKLRWRPDFILLNDFKPDYCPFVHGFRDLNIPVGAIMHDLQYKRSSRKHFIEKENIRHLFTIYRDPFLKWFPEFADRMIWFPHHVPTDLFKDDRLPRPIHWLMMGSVIEQLYPLRVQILHTMKNQQGFVYHPHPGYRTVKEHERNAWVGQRYVKEINRAKMFLTSDSVYQFPVLKYYEVAACRTLLLASASKELNDLGFKPGKTFVAVNAANFQEAAKYYLHHDKERRDIAERGYQMVRERHSTKKRAAELISNIQQIMNEKSKGALR